MDDQITLMALPKSRFLSFEPRDDITPLEAAWLAHFFASLSTLHSAENHEAWNIIQRHFVEEDINLP